MNGLEKKVALGVSLMVGIIVAKKLYKASGEQVEQESDIAKKTQPIME